MTGDGARRRIAAEWARRTNAEYTSAAIAQTVTLWLVQLGAPPDLLRDGLRIVEDELAHSELCAEVAEAASAGSALPLEAGQLHVAGTGDLVADVTAAVVRSFCVGETVAVPLFAMLASAVDEPLAVTALERIRRDEARHRTFAWDVLDWLLLTHEPTARPVLDALAWPALDALVAAHERVGADTGIGTEERGWGLAAPAHYAAVARRSADEDVTPRFVARGVPAR